jgi:adhesin/invasin
MKRSVSIVTFVILLPRSVFGTGDGTFQAPARVDVSQIAISLTSGRFIAGGNPGIAAVHGSNRVTVLLPDPWREATAISVGNSCYQLRACDVDGDGDDDLGIADPGSVGYVFLSNGDGTFVKKATLTGAVGARAVIFGDWNGDGEIDLATINHPSSDASIYSGNGDGTFLHLRNMTVGAFEHNHDMDVGDYDGDGIVDLLVAVDFQGVQPLRGVGDGHFQPKEIDPSSGSPLFMAAADFDKDGLTDFVTFSREDSSVCRSNGGGTFPKTQGIPNLSCLPARGDMDGDGIPDLVGIPNMGDSVQIFPGKGNARFDDPILYGVACRNSQQVLAADLDLDGNLDVAAADGDTSSILIIRGNGGAGLDLPIPLGSYGTGKACAVGDVNRDGIPDILIASTQSKIDVFLDPGKSPPSTAAAFSIDTQSTFSSLDALDLDADGIGDLAGTVSTGSLVVATLDADAKVRQEIVLAAGNLPGPVAAGRIDGDALVDLAVPCSGPGHVAVFLTAGGGGFAGARIVASVPKVARAVIADLDGDGQSDIAAISTTILAVHWGRGGGEFDAPATVHSGKSLRDLVAGDLNGDGLPDLAVCDTILRQVVVFHGKGNRSFEAAPAIGLSDVVSSIALADLDGSGLPDLVGLPQGNASVLVFLNGGASGLGTPKPYGLGQSATAQRLADLDGDGALDVVAFGPSKTVILFGKPAEEPTIRRGDADGSGHVDLSDAIRVLESLYLGGGPLPCDDAADASDDGDLDLTDPIAILGHLFLGEGALPSPGTEVCGLDPTGDGLGCQAECR